MPETSLLDTVPVLRELRDDLAEAYAVHERRPVRPPRRRRRPRLRLAAVAGVAAALVAIVAALPAGERGTTAILEAAAATAATQPPTTPAPGAYAYFKETGDSGVQTTLEWWVARNGSGRVLQTMRIGNDFERPADDPRLPHYTARPSDDSALPRWKRAGTGWVRDIRFGRGRFAETHSRVASTVLPVDVRSLSDDPDALQSALLRKLAAAATDSDPETGFRGGANPASWQVLTVIEQALAHPLASPQQRSALYRVAARLDGVEAVEDVEDPVGRPATVLRLVRQTNPGTVRTEVYFDPATSATLARRIVTSADGHTTTDGRVYTPLTTVDALARP